MKNAPAKVTLSVGAPMKSATLHCLSNDGKPAPKIVLGKGTQFELEVPDEIVVVQLAPQFRPLAKRVAMPFEMNGVDKTTLGERTVVTALP